LQRNHIASSPSVWYYYKPGELAKKEDVKRCSKEKEWGGRNTIKGVPHNAPARERGRTFARLRKKGKVRNERKERKKKVFCRMVCRQTYIKKESRSNLR